MIDFLISKSEINLRVAFILSAMRSRSVLYILYLIIDDHARDSIYSKLADMVFANERDS